MTVTFKALCIDARDPARLQSFWASTLGLRPESRGAGNLLLTGDRPERTVWINEVPEPHSVKNRVHFDVNTSSIEELVERGARVLDQSHPWTIMVDPEGNEFDAFVREPDQLDDYRLNELTVDGTDALASSRWWGERFGRRPQQEADQPVWAIEGGGLPCPMVFAEVPEPKTVKNRVHWDVVGVTQEFLDAGARLLRPADREIAWDVLADPEGNEFCVFRP